ncbi:hypothetical protein [Nonomuraea antri]|uniref:hypothetical protein n=1 Tax=Nonomuraea antri TaxID=2730852 RepID=UPI0015698DBA|nr:hypothetical protein [Nonomuraea antri]
MSIMSKHFEVIFDSPDLATDAEIEGLPKVTDYYTATMTRTGKRWTATCRDLPGGRVVEAQGKSWREARRGVGRLISDAVAGEPGLAAVHVVPADPEEDALLAAVLDARYERAYAEQAERDAVRHAARTLLDRGWTTRDVGSLLLLSHQRISQIVRRPAGQISHRPSDESAGGSADRIADGPSDESAGGPADQIADRPADRIIDRLSDESVGGPAD